MTRRLLALFASTHDVIKAERICIKAAIPVQVVPVPRAISSDCGMAIEIRPALRTALTKTLEEAGVLIRNIVEVDHEF